MNQASGYTKDLDPALGGHRPAHLVLWRRQYAEKGWTFMRTTRFLALSILSAFAAAGAGAQTSPSPPVIESLQTPGSIFAAAGPACTGGVQVDDGTFETGYFVSGSDSQIVQRLTPPQYPSRLTRACICWIAGNPATTLLSYNLVIYDDNGANGQPGFTSLFFWGRSGSPLVSM
jgi:hypothetical protein